MHNAWPVRALVLHGLAHPSQPLGRLDDHQDATQTPRSAGADLTHEGCGRGFRRRERRGGEWRIRQGCLQAPNLGASLPQASHFASVWKCPSALCGHHEIWLASVCDSLQKGLPSHLESSKVSESGRSHERVSRASHVGCLIGNQTPQVCEVPPRMTGDSRFESLSLVC